MKKLIETRNQKLQEMDSLLEKVKTENRAFTEDEQKRFDELEGEVRSLNATIAAQAKRNAAGATQEDPKEDPSEDGEESEEDKKKREKAEERAFGGYIRNMVERRADTNLTLTDNGAVIPHTVADKIIEMVYDISPIVQMATRYNVSGTIAIPYYDETNGKLTVAYADEFSELESSAGKFKSIELKDFLAGCLSKVSRSLINKVGFDLVGFVIRKMAEAIAMWLEGECINGTTDKITGMDKGITQNVTAAAADKITGDELMDVQDAVPDAFQANAIWVMNRKTRTAIRKLKNLQGDYLLQRDLNAKWGYTLLGKDVYTTDNVPAITAGKTAIYYGDMSGLALKIGEEMNIQVLTEKYATQHAIGVVGWIEADAKVEHTQKLSKLTMKAGA